MYEHHILDYFYLFKVYLISFRFHLINYFEKFECMEYICDKIIHVTKFEILNIYFKTRVVDGIIG
jgi:NADPH-dependent 7-cyano-7-deazaguanine reductase QueF